MAWLDHTRPDAQIATMEALIDGADDPTLEAEATSLDRSLFAPKQPATSAWAGRTFFRQVANARSRRLSGAEAPRTIAEDLPPLNPQ